MPPKVTEVARVDVGKLYLVPTVRYPWCRVDNAPPKTIAWPVLGPIHEDQRYINYPDLHYHADGRFLSQRDWSWISRNSDRPVEYTIMARPISQNTTRLRLPNHSHPAPVWRPRICKRVFDPILFREEHGRIFPQLHAAFRGRRCKRNAAGALICPHKGAVLNMQTDPDGAYTCPLHGLRIDAETGVVL